MARAVLKSKATLDDRQFNRGLTRMGQNVQAFGSGQLASLTGAMAGAFSIGVMVRAGKAVMENADRVADLSDALGITAEEFQTLESMTRRYGGTMGQVEKAMMALQRRTGAALEGNVAYLKALEKAGFKTREELAGASLKERFVGVGRAIREAKTEAEAMQLADTLLSESGRELVNVLRLVGEDGLDPLVEKYKKLGEVATNEQFRALAAANNALEVLQKRTSTGTAKGLGGFLMGEGPLTDYFKHPVAQAMPGVGPVMSVISRLMGSGLNPIRGEVYQDQLERARKARREKEARRAALAEQLSGAGDMRFSPVKAADSLAAIGGMIGGQSSNAEHKLEALIKSAERQEKLLEKNVENTGATREAVEE